MNSAGKSLATLLLVACLTGGSMASISPWFSSSFTDFHQTLKRFSSCVSFLEPIKSKEFTESKYLLKQATNFLDNANLSNEQLANLTKLMDTICLKQQTEYPISANINATEFKISKKLRCQAIDDALFQIYPLLKRASYDSSEKLDFSTIKFHAVTSTSNFVNNATSKPPLSFNLTDLINTAWIQSNFARAQVCELTDEIKAHIAAKQTAVARRVGSSNLESAPPSGVVSGVKNYVNNVVSAVMERFFGLERRAYWESATLVHQLANGLHYGVSSGLGGLNSGLRGIGGRIVNISSSLVGSSNSTKAAKPLATNSVVSSSGVELALASESPMPESSGSNSATLVKKTAKFPGGAIAKNSNVIAVNTNNGKPANFDVTSVTAAPASVSTGKAAATALNNANWPTPRPLATTTLFGNNAVDGEPAAVTV